MAEKNADVDDSNLAKTTDPENIQTIAALGYLGPLFLVPLLVAPKNEFAMFHANQGLVLFICVIALNFIAGLIPIIGWLIILPVGNLLSLVLIIMGMVNALNGKQTKLPVIGQFTLLKVER